MAKYTLSREAEKDLIRIHQFGNAIYDSVPYHSLGLIAQVKKGNQNPQLLWFFC
jgi:hypothetical protein